MKHPLQDVVVVLPGIMGSALADESGDEVWGTSLGTLAKGVLTGARAIKRLAAAIRDRRRRGARRRGGDAPADDIHVIPGIWSVTIGYDRQMQWFRDTFDVVEAGDASTRRPNFVPFRTTGACRTGRARVALKAFVEPMLERFRAEPGHADAKVVFVAHSMGGLVVRYFTDVLGGHEITRQGDHPRHAAPRRARTRSTRWSTGCRRARVR